MADTIVNLDSSVLTVSVPSGTSGQLNGVPGYTYDIYNVGESGNTVYFSMCGGAVVKTGTTGADCQFILATGGQMEWTPDPSRPYISFCVAIGTSVLSVKRRGS